MLNSCSGGVAIHVCADVITSGVRERWPPVLACKDVLPRIIRISRQLGVTEQHVLSGERATTSTLLDTLCAAGSAVVDGNGLVIVTFSGHTERGKGPLETACWCMRDRGVELSQIALHLARLPPTTRVLLICNTCYGGAIAEVIAGVQPVIVVASCGAEQTMVDRPRSEFMLRLEDLVCVQRRCDSLAALRAALEADTPDCERPVVWSNVEWHDRAL